MYRAYGFPPLFLLLTLFLSLSSLPNPSTADTNSFIYGGCSQLTYSPGSAYESNLNSLLTSLVNSATYSSFNKLTFSGSTQQDVVYGLYQCQGDLSMPDCSNCIQRAVSQLGILCPSSTGGAVQLQGCFIKYDNTSFLGVEDKTVVVKKCGPPVSYESDLISQRDAVLNGLASGGGLYRVGGSGEVQGVAQCVGDLSANECQDCLSSAIGRLRSECGAAAYGDMFLGKCYVRYSTGGDHSHGSNGSSSSSSQQNQTSKTLAIIIGMLALVALIIIFVSFISRAIERRSGGK
ncbi:plasmodesmata-located protein 7-like isoform X2 [Telopea speciosissima]|uniref:plasmodesmata-located protein 7-like isoform X2 n=1 Tax=Telopea speciosissima TaxID=54955 RepID=UPI001CC63C29|nr:plasmodesmata-located protein 7-like isoform X2 [Telopea speciosissima]